MALEDSALFSKIYGGLIGAAVGDALGGPVEGLDYPEIERLHGRVERMLPYDKAPSEHGQFTNEAGVEQSLISNDLTHDQRCDLFLERTGVRISRP